MLVHGSYPSTFQASNRSEKAVDQTSSFDVTQDMVPPFQRKIIGVCHQTRVTERVPLQ